MAKTKATKPTPKTRRSFSKEFKQDAVQMMVDGHSASSIARNLGIENSNLLYRWKADFISNGGPATVSLDSQVRELREELLRTRKERDILKKALAIFSQHE